MWYWPGTGTLWTSPYFFGGREFRATENGAIGIYTRSSVALPCQKGPRLCENSDFGLFWCRWLLDVDLSCLQVEERCHKSGPFRRFEEHPIVSTQSGPFFERFDVEADIGLKLTNFRFVRRADLYAKRSESPVSAHSAYCCVWFEGRRKPSAGPFNLSHWPSLLHPCREQKSSAARFASLSFVNHADSSDALGREARHRQLRERGRPSKNARQVLGSAALSSWP
jgi:hypothetical protein